MPKINDYRTDVIITLKDHAVDLHHLIEAHPKELPASNAVLDELLRLKLEVARSLQRLA